VGCGSAGVGVHVADEPGPAVDEPGPLADDPEPPELVVAAEPAQEAARKTAATVTASGRSMADIIARRAGPALRDAGRGFLPPTSSPRSVPCRCLPPVSKGEPPEHRHRILPPEAEPIDDGRVHLCLARGERHVVQVALW